MSRFDLRHWRLRTSSTLCRHREAEERAVHDVGQIMLQLMKKNAIVIGAIRRPVRGSAAAVASAIPPNKYANLAHCDLIS